MFERMSAAHDAELAGGMRFDTPLPYYHPQPLAKLHGALN